MMLPLLDEHLEFEIKVANDAELHRYVEELLRIDTCFAIIGGENRIRTTERGMEALRNT